LQSVPSKYFGTQGRTYTRPGSTGSLNSKKLNHTIPPGFCSDMSVLSLTSGRCDSETCFAIACIPDLTPEATPSSLQVDYSSGATFKPPMSKDPRIAVVVERKNTKVIAQCAQIFYHQTEVITISNSFSLTITSRPVNVTVEQAFESYVSRASSTVIISTRTIPTR
jgi:hypothetical protein